MSNADKIEKLNDNFDFIQKEIDKFKSKQVLGVKDIEDIKRFACIQEVIVATLNMLFEVSN